MERTEVETRSKALPLQEARTHVAPVAQDTTRWGPIWAGLVTIVAVFLLLESLFIAFGALTYTSSSGTPTLHSSQLWIAGILGVVSFFAGGWMASSMSAVRGSGAGAVNGFLVWALATGLFVLGSVMGAGAALGAVGNLINALPINVLGRAANAASVPSQGMITTAAWWAFGTLAVTALAALLGGWLGGVGRSPVGYVGTEDRR